MSINKISFILKTKHKIQINLRISWSVGEISIPHNFHFNEEKSSTSKISFCNCECISSERLKEIRFTIYIKSLMSYLKILKKYLSENAAMPQNWDNVTFASDVKSSRAITCLINRWSIVPKYASNNASRSTYQFSYDQ